MELRISPMAARISMLVVGALVVMLGSSIIASEQTVLSKPMILLAAAVILGLEIGFKNILNAGKSRSSPNLIAGILLLALIVLALASFFSFNAPSWLESASNFIVVLSGLWIAIEAFF